MDVRRRNGAPHHFRLLVVSLLFGLGVVGARLAQAWPGQDVPYNYGTQFTFIEPPSILDGIQSTGVKWCRTVIDKNWATVSPGVYDFSRWDALHQGMSARGMFPLFILMGDVNNPPDTQAEINDYLDFAGQAAAHYNGHIVVWEIWNEPNNQNFWRSGPNAALYASFAIQMAARIKAVSPGATVVAPGSGKIDLAFISAMLQAQPTLLQYLDGVSVHPYRPTNAEVPETRLPLYDQLAATYAPYVPAGKSVPIVDTEWGYYTGGSGAISEANQASYLQRKFLLNHLKGIPISIWYEYKNSGTTTNPEHNFGMVRANYTPKPALTACRVLTQQLSGWTWIDRLTNNGLGNLSGNDFVLRFYNWSTGTWKAAVWTRGSNHSISLHLVGTTKVTNSTGGVSYLTSGPAGWIQVPLSAGPRFLDVPPGNW